MKRRTLGRSDVEVSAIGLGTNNFGWRLDQAEAKKIIDLCHDLGIDFLDTADIYGEGASEEMVGRAVQGRRDDFFIASKVGLPWEDGSRPGGLAGEYVTDSVEQSLERLRTDHIDLLQLHRPDPATPIEETLETLSGLVEEGKIRYVGCSNFMVWEMVEWLLQARHHQWPEFVSIQAEYSMLVRDAETELLHACDRFDISLIPHRPLAQGFLTGKYRRGGDLPGGARLTLQDKTRQLRFTDENFKALDVLVDVADAKTCTPAQVAIAWLLDKEMVTSVIAGASSPAQLAENAAATDISLTGSEIEALAVALPRVPGGAVGAVHMRPNL
jgi:aryl-alcohol dehydrogenase-like predicted oxidoreductase